MMPATHIPPAIVPPFTPDSAVRKVRAAEVLSGSMQNLLKLLQFSGRVSVVLQNGRVLKSGYEEGFFRQHEPGSGLEPGVTIEP